MKKCVSFSDKITFYEEPAEHVEALHQARISDINRRRADKARQEALLNPVMESAYKKYLSTIPPTCRAPQ